ncbi:MAG: murein biosynthesis integral membrane protein MurJ [Chloroflexota bacterium]
MTPLRRLLERAVPRGAILLSVLTFGSYAMGLVRDRFFAQTFGAGIDLDAYNAAFQIPELALDVLVASGLVAPFIPIFTGLRGESDAAAERFARTVLTAAVLVMSAAVAILFVLAPETARIAAPGFDDGERALYTDLFRLMCVTPIIFAASITLGEVLIARQRFLYYGLAPILYNAGIVLGTVLLAESIGIFAAAVGAVIGALLHLAIRIIGIARTDVRIRPSFAFREPSFVAFVKLMLPKMLSHPIEPVLFLYFTAVATTLGAGSVSALSFARNFQSVPVSLIGVSFSLAVFPALSAAWAAGDRASYVRILTANVVTIAILTVVAAIGLVVVGELGIRVLLGGGAFDADDVARTALVLAAFAISVPFDALTHPLSRALYATRNTVLQVLASLAGLVVTVLATAALVGEAGIVAIPLGFAMGAATKVGLLALALVSRLRATPDQARPGPPRPSESGR